MAATGWDWLGDEERKSTVVRPVNAIAVYTNLNGDVVIRQQGEIGGEDSLVVAPKSAIQDLINALAAAIKE